MEHTNRQKAELKALSGKKYSSGYMDKFLKEGSNVDKQIERQTAKKIKSQSIGKVMDKHRAKKESGKAFDNMMGNPMESKFMKGIK